MQTVAPVLTLDKFPPEERVILKAMH